MGFSENPEYESAKMPRSNTSRQLSSIENSKKKTLETIIDSQIKDNRNTGGHRSGQNLKRKDLEMPALSTLPDAKHSSGFNFLGAATALYGVEPLNLNPRKKKTKKSRRRQQNNNTSHTIKPDMEFKMQPSFSNNVIGKLERNTGGHTSKAQREYI